LYSAVFGATATIAANAGIRCSRARIPRPERAHSIFLSGENNVRGSVGATLHVHGNDLRSVLVDLVRSDLRCTDAAPI